MQCISQTKKWHICSFNFFFFHTEIKMKINKKKVIIIIKNKLTNLLAKSSTTKVICHKEVEWEKDDLNMPHNGHNVSLLLLLLFLLNILLLLLRLRRSLFQVVFFYSSHALSQFRKQFFIVWAVLPIIKSDVWHILWQWDTLPHTVSSMAHLLARKVAICTQKFQLKLI